MTKAGTNRQGWNGDFGHTKSFDSPERALTPEEENALLDDWSNDPEFEAYVRAKVQESLDDPRPPVPSEEVWARVDQWIEEARRKYPG